MKKTKKLKKPAPKRKSVAKPKPAKPKNALGFTPAGDRVLVKPLPAESRTASGIIIPETAKEKPEQGVVVAVGAGKWDDGKLVPVSAKVGQKIMFSKYGYEEVKLGGVEYFLVSESSILGILN